MFYQQYALQQLALAPLRALANNALTLFEVPGNPLRHTPFGRITNAMLDTFEHATRPFAKPRFGLTTTLIDQESVPIEEEVIGSDAWCELRRFRRVGVERPHDPTLLIVAPLSGHYATLLRGTVAAFLPDHDVVITDWRDARMVPLIAGDFDLDDYIDFVIRAIRKLGPRTHVLAVCQPAVPVLAAASLMADEADPCAPLSMTLIGGPIDTREAPTAVNRFAQEHSLDWFRRHVIDTVPFGNPGFLRQVYPGFVQLAGFMAMNLDRHMEAHWQMFLNLVDGDGENHAAKRCFYDEYQAVMDLPAAYYLQTIATVFQDHQLPRGQMVSRGRRVDPGAITRTALLTIEGERDDISGLGQTRAAHALVRRLPAEKRAHREQAGVGHYGLFNGRRFIAEIVPAIQAFIRDHC